MNTLLVIAQATSRRTGGDSLDTSRMAGTIVAICVVVGVVVLIVQKARGKSKR